VYTEDDLLPISALQHLLFCERQCALIHIEGVWADNRLTVEGHHLHEKAHAGPDERRQQTRVVRGLPLRSLRLGLAGMADVVQFHPDPEGGPPTIFPIEYKRGSPKKSNADRVQLCAQALCLEEMLDASVPQGALFYGRTRRRLKVAFDAELREETIRAAARLRDLIVRGVTPTAMRQPKCRNCSLVDVCLPTAFRPRRTASDYLRRALQGSCQDPGDEEAPP
jgi:CRISPR-associated exonuclease Cas4